MPAVNVTVHAISRYVERIKPGTPFLVAKSKILSEFEVAIREKTRTHSGDAYYAGPEFRLVVAEENGSRTVLTVLQKGDAGRSEEIPELALALNAQYLEWEKASTKLSKTDAKAQQQLELALRVNKELRAGIAKRDKTIQSILDGQVKPRQYCNVSAQKYERQVEHGKRMSEERDKLRRALWDVCRLLRNGIEADKVLSMLCEAFPFLVGDHKGTTK